MNFGGSLDLIKTLTASGRRVIQVIEEMGIGGPFLCVTTQIGDGSTPDAYLTNYDVRIIKKCVVYEGGDLSKRREIVGIVGMPLGKKGVKKITHRKTSTRSKK